MRLSKSPNSSDPLNFGLRLVRVKSTNKSLSAFDLQFSTWYEPALIWLSLCFQIKIEVHLQLSDLRPGSPSQKHKVILAGVLITTAIYILLTVGSYVLFGEGVKPDVLQNFSVESLHHLLPDWLSWTVYVIVRLSFLAGVLTLYPLMVRPPAPQDYQLSGFPPEICKSVLTLPDSCCWRALPQRHFVLHIFCGLEWECNHKCIYCLHSMLIPLKQVEAEIHSI